MRSSKTLGGSEIHEQVPLQEKGERNLRHTETQARNHVKTEGETKVMLIQAKEQEETPEAGKSKKGFSFGDIWGSVNTQTTSFQSSAFQNSDRKKKVVLKPPIVW